MRAADTCVENALGRLPVPDLDALVERADHVHEALGHRLMFSAAMAFREPFERVPDIHAVRESDLLHSPFFHGVKRLDCEFTPS